MCGGTFACTFACAFACTCTPPMLRGAESMSKRRQPIRMSGGFGGVSKIPW